MGAPPHWGAEGPPGGSKVRVALGDDGGFVRRRVADRECKASSGRSVGSSGHKRRLLGRRQHTKGLSQGQQHPVLTGPGGLRQRTKAGGGMEHATPLKLVTGENVLEVNQHDAAIVREARKEQDGGKPIEGEKLGEKGPRGASVLFLPPGSLGR